VVASARLSLARTAALLMPTQSQTKRGGLAEETTADLAPTIEKTDWGDAQRIRFPLTIGGIVPSWDYSAGRLRTAEARWVSP
jgi:hypothetical protein